MKATEVLKEYAAGRRDFRGEDLRGQNFKGKDLSEADFSECDIRGTNFKEANLTQTKFIKARAGLQLHSQLLLLAGAMILVTLSGICSGWSGYYISWIFDGYDLQDHIIGWTSLIVLLIFSFVSYFQGLRTGLAVGVVAGTGAAAIAFAGVGAVAGTGAGTGAVAVAFAIAFSRARVAVVAGAFAGSVVGVRAFAGSVDRVRADTVAVAVAVAVALTLLASIIAYRTLKGDPRDAWLREFALAFASVRGTCFYCAIVTHADFTGATLRNSDLRAKSLIRTRFQGVMNLDLARVGNTLLSQPNVRDLLINPNQGYNKDYFKADLRGANLDDANLKGANLTQADLSEATLKNADLRDSNLTEVNAINTNFTHVYLTGACLEGWNIDNSTILDNIDCQYVYFLNNKQERRPSSGDFEPGEFSKLFKQVLDSIILIFNNGVNWKAFASAFKEVEVKHRETPLEIETIENKGEGMVVIKVKVSSGANKAQIHQDFKQDYQKHLKQIEASYQKQLQGRDNIIEKSEEQINSLDNIIEILANVPDPSEPMKTVNLLPNGQDIDSIEEETTVTQNKIPSKAIQELHKEYKKTKQLIEEKYQAVLESKQDILESKQIQLEEKQEEIDFLRKQLSQLETFVKTALTNNDNTNK